MTAPQVLVVVHEAARSGPPIYVHHLLTWLRANTDLDLGVLLLAPGPLIEDFQVLCPTVVDEGDDESVRRLVEDSELVYLNTAISVQALRRTGARPRRLLTHVHELEVGLRHYLPAEDHDLLVELTDRYLVGPDVARDNLALRHGISPADIGQVPYFVPPHEPLPARSAANRAELGLPPDAFVVGAAGTREWRKAPDLFTHLAWEVTRRPGTEAFHFVWLGSAIPSEPHWDQTFDLEHLGLHGRLDFVEHQAVPQRWMAEYDVFALTSREDCFPLVCLGSAELGTPIVCFDNGGIPELLRACEGGRVVPYPQLAAMADELQALAADPDGRRAMGRRAQDHVAGHHQLAQTGPAVEAELRGMLP